MRTKSKHFDLNLLRVFVAAYRSQSVTKAADELDMTQSAVSNALARLKEGAGQELFSRTGRGIKRPALLKTFINESQCHY
ncbi:transcriptional regulator [Vibrio ishigakensis]|uniref:Transcriptional regulator n=1 Tax=Vibrio ishigakensis TaxID=1481914 RepID=A0A0B8QIN4_9VIBR|nr:transcriptional regulator [Vibrio ishigakensis]